LLVFSLKRLFFYLSGESYTSIPTIYPGRIRQGTPSSSSAEQEQVGPAVLNFLSCQGSELFLLWLKIKRLNFAKAV
jgi:hypothetical protein